MENKEIINTFAKNINCLNEIYKELSDVNPFEILEIDQKESIHSNFLAWLLNPTSSSGIGDKFLKKLLVFCSENSGKNPEAKNGLDVIRIELMDIDDVIIKRELPINKPGKRDRRIDLFLTFDDKGDKDNGFLICIENKINSGEGKDQLSDYYEYVEALVRKDTKYKKYKYDNRYYIFLSPTGIEANANSDKENWIALSYSDIYNWLEDLLETYKENIPQKAKELIRDYLNALQRHVIEGKFKETCENIYMNHIDAFTIFEQYQGRDILDNATSTDGFKLYQKHKGAIDLVLKNRTKLSEKIKLRLIDAIRETGQLVQYDPSRAPAYLKANRITDDVRLVDPNCKDVSKDFLVHELYYSPGEKRFYLNLRCQIKNCPAGFDCTKYGKELKTDRPIKSKRLKKNPADYLSELEKDHREPFKDDGFIQDLCKEVIVAINRTEVKDECQRIINAIS